MILRSISSKKYARLSVIVSDWKVGFDCGVLRTLVNGKHHSAVLAANNYRAEIRMYDKGTLIIDAHNGDHDSL